MKKLLIALTILTTATVSVAQDDFLREKNLAELYPFYHGVASGDPLSDRVIIWTRVTDDTLTSNSVTVEWRIATDTNMTNIVNSGVGTAFEVNDWTFKEDVTGLQPNTWYYYDFRALNHFSIRGRTKTAPVGDVDSLRFGVVSCSNYEHGYFGAYRHLMSRNDIDCILHLGDYIYEYAVGGYSSNITGRENEPSNEIITLEDYRIRHSHYKLDEDLRKLHQQYPFINVWDDHESSNDSYKDGAENHDPATEGNWADRKVSFSQAYHEWLPIRSPQPGDLRIYRAFEFGDLINMPMIDTRIEGRDEQGGAAETTDPSRSLLGTVQYNWLTNNLSNSTKQWNIVGNQVMIAPLELFGTPINYDQWDGYDYERQQLLDHIINNNIENFIVLTGDIHTSWVNDIPHSGYDAGNCTGSAGVEFVTTSVTSPGAPISGGSFIIQSSNPHNQYFELTKRGYGVLDVNKQRTQFDFYYVDNITDPNTNQYYAQGYLVNDGERCANQASGFSVSNTANTVPFAPELPLPINTGVENLNYQEFVVFGAYPNPAYDEVTFQIYMNKTEDLSIQVFDFQGKEVFYDIMENLYIGINYAKLNISSLAQGTYSFVIKSENNVVSKSIVKTN